MTNRMSPHAWVFTASFLREAKRHGLRVGSARAASRVSPALLVIEAAASMARAVDSYLQLCTARAHRDGLERLIPLEERRLERERQQLAETLDLARRELETQRAVRQRIGELVLICAQAYRACLDELQAIRAADLPDLEAFDRSLEQLEEAQADLRRAFEQFNAISI